jgi:hypothetical protein
MDEGLLPRWSDLPAPSEAREYYHLRDDATFRDVILAIRADESCHRTVNHYMASVPQDWDIHKYALHLEEGEINIEQVVIERSVKEYKFEEIEEKNLDEGLKEEIKDEIKKDSEAK